MHHDALAYVAHALATMPKADPPLVVEFGSRNVNGSVRPLFSGVRYIGVDLLPGPGVDVQADAATYTPPEPAGVVVCCEVLEHAPDAGAIVANAYRILAPGGVLILTAAGEGRIPHSAVDGKPRLYPGEFYANVTSGDLTAWLAPFWAVSYGSDPTRRDVRATAWKGGLNA